MSSVSLERRVISKKDALCSAKYPEYSKDKTDNYVFKPATCSKKNKKNKPTKRQIRADIEKVIAELDDNGHILHIPFSDLKLPHKTLQTDTVLVNNHAVAMTHMFALQNLHAFLQNPWPVKKNAESLARKWREAAGLPKDGGNIRNVPMLIGVLLTHALDFYK